MSSMSDTMHPRVFDLRIALLAGERVWHDGPIRPGPRERISAGFALIGTACTATAIWVTVSARFDPWDFDAITTRGATPLGFTVAATLASLPVGVRYQRILRWHETVGRSLWFELAWRSAAFFVLLLTVFAGALPRGYVPGVAPLGVLAGADASLTI